MKKLRYWSVCYGSSSSPTTTQNKTMDVTSTTTNNSKEKDESFFDSQPWLQESDCDDFFSMNGDQTPSRTPVTTQKKSLSDLFCESFDSRSTSSKLSSSASYLRATTDQEHKPKPDSNYCGKQQQIVDTRKSANNSQQFCLPALMRSISCSSSSERKKQRS